ncbi:hypothetical protein M758_5G066300 [Ceratodon purpureus]|nr:hypothetical protein M758_5G066300 [Ceratodon purpureus]
MVGNATSLFGAVCELRECDRFVCRTDRGVAFGSGSQQATVYTPLLSRPHRVVYSCRRVPGEEFTRLVISKYTVIKLHVMSPSSVAYAKA